MHIAITSRSLIAKEMTTLDAVEVADMEPSEAEELFQGCAKMKEKTQDIITEVARIVNEPGCSALAITLAGSYVLVTPRLSSHTCRYLSDRQWRKELLRQRAKRHINHYGERVLSTWEASFKVIEEHNPAAEHDIQSPIQFWILNYELPLDTFMELLWTKHSNYIQCPEPVSQKERSRSKFLTLR